MLNNKRNWSGGLIIANNNDLPFSPPSATQQTVILKGRSEIDQEREKQSLLTTSVLINVMPF
jgi:hypothetical protein